MQFPLEFLVPATLLLQGHAFRLAGLAPPADRVLLPGLQLGRIDAMFATPRASSDLVHHRRRDHRLQPRRSGPVSHLITRGFGQALSPPTLRVVALISRLPSFSNHPESIGEHG